MNISNMPITKFVGIYNDKELCIDISENIKNHIGTIHAGALFVLAESASGMYLSQKFPQLKEQVIPILRESQIKYKKSAEGKVIAFAHVDDEVLEKFEKQFLSKERAVITVEIELQDENQEIVVVGKFSWFVQKI